MPALILYLLKINVALILFYLAYRFALRRLTFYTLNRIFLVSGIIFSSICPFIDFSGLFRENQQLNDQLIVIVPDWNAVRQVVLPDTSFDYWQLLVIIFWAGVSIMALRLLIQLMSLYKIHRSSIAEALNNYKIRRVNRDIMPFSFWQTIYLNPDQYERDELTAILQHEKIHVREWHTLDVLLAEVSVVFYWFNPGVWLMKQAIKENLEFITDQRVLNSGLDCKTYQYSLVRMIFSSESPSLVNNFSFISIKKRIKMMNKKQSSQAQISRYLLIMPMVVILTLVFTISKAQLENKSLKHLKKSGITAVKVAAESVSSIPSALTEAAKIFVSDPTPVKDKTITDTTKTAASTAKTLTVYKSPALTESKSTTVVDTPIGRVIRIRGSNTVGNSNEPLFVVDGVIGVPNALSSLNPDDVLTMEVLKDSNATAIFGEKGRNGVVVITTKKGKGTFFNLVKSGTRPVLINGKEATQKQIDKLTVDEINDIRLIFNSDFLKQFGEKGTSGVLGVTTK